jgi:alpha-N-arabinofuranosidase
MRAANGNAEPFEVKYWGIGNESQVWFDDAKDYAKLIERYVKLMKAVDPSIYIVAAGAYRVGEYEKRSKHGNWNQTILELAGDKIDSISIHPYHGISPKIFGSDARCARDYRDFVAWPLRVEKEIIDLKQKIALATHDNRVKIALDEWGVIHADGYPENGGEQTCTLKDAIYTSGFFHMVFRQHECVQMTNFCDLVNALPALITRGDRLYVNPIYHVLSLYSNYAGVHLLDAKTNVWGFEAAGIEDRVPYLDCAATLDENRRSMSVFVLNRNENEAIATTMLFRGYRPAADVQVFEINAESVDSVNGFDEPENVSIEEKQWQIGEPRPVYTFPAHSVTLLRVTAAA